MDRDTELAEAEFDASTFRIPTPIWSSRPKRVAVSLKVFGEVKVPKPLSSNENGLHYI